VSLDGPLPAGPSPGPQPGVCVCPGGRRRICHVARSVLTMGVVLAVGLVLAGCNGVEQAPLPLATAGVTATADVSDLASVLAEAADERGRIIPDKLPAVRGRLDAQLAKMAVAGPTATPELFTGDDDRAAYWLNARAGWSIKLADLAGLSERVDPDAMLSRRFPLDGREMSLAAIDETLLAEAGRRGDFRIAACAPGALVDWAPLPAEPFVGASLDERLRRELSRLALDERRLVIDVERRQVRIGRMLWACRDLVRDRPGGSGEANAMTLRSALIEHVDLRAARRLQEGIGYEDVPQKLRPCLEIVGRKIFYPGKIGRVEVRPKCE
jgi:hypothetical protein